MTQAREHLEMSRYVLLAAALVLTLVLYRDTFESIISIWNRSGTFAHGWIIVPISIFLIYRQRHAVVRAGLSQDYWVAVLILGVIGVWVLARLAGVLVLEQLAAVSLIPFTVWLFLGTRACLRILFPLAFLWFAVPFGEFLIPYLMQFTAEFTVLAVRLTGIPIYQDGLYFSLPTGNFEVAVACSGIRYLIASLALGSVFAYLNYNGWRKRVIFMLLALAIPLVANGLRAFGIVMIAHASGMKLATGVDHLVYGWLFFGLVIFVMFWVGGRFADKAPANSDDVSTVSDSVGNASTVILSLLGIVLILMGPATLSWLKSGSIPDTANQEVVLPEALNGWQMLDDQPDGNWLTPNFPGHSRMHRALYRSKANEIEFLSTHYFGQTQDAELINSENRVFDPEQWDQVRRDSTIVTMTSGIEIPVEIVSLMGDGREYRIWQWYLVDEREVTSSIKAKLLETWGLVRRDSSGSHLFSFALRGNSDPSADDLLHEFVSQHYKTLKQCAIQGFCEGDPGGR